MGCIHDVTRDLGSRGDAIQKLNGICLKYNKVITPKTQGRDKELGYGSGELSLVKQDGGFLSGSHGNDGFILHLPSFVPVKEKLPLSLLFNSLK